MPEMTTTATTTEIPPTAPTPLADALAAAVAAAKIAEQAWLDDDTSDTDACVGMHSRDCHHPSLMATRAADAAVEACLAALVASDEPRMWSITEGGVEYATTLASGPDEALKIARDLVDPDSYDFSSTMWLDIWVVCVTTAERAKDTVQLEPPDPPCARGRTSHEWNSPWSVVGGDEANPGVWGHGGGVRIKEVCCRCGSYRLTDTWATRPDTGEQGYTTHEFEDADDASQAWVSSLPVTPLPVELPPDESRIVTIDGLEQECNPALCGVEDCDTYVSEGVSAADMISQRNLMDPDESLINAMGRDWIVKVALADDEAEDDDNEAWEKFGLPWCKAYNKAFNARARELADKEQGR